MMQKAFHVETEMARLNPKQPSPYTGYPSAHFSSPSYSGVGGSTLRDSSVNIKASHQRGALTSRTHRPIKRLLLMWVWTLAVMAAIVAIVISYRNKGVITHSQKNTFNGLTTALILLLGLSYFGAFKELARHLPDHLKSWFRPLSSVEPLIDDFDNLFAVGELVYTKLPIPWSLRLFGLAWIALNLMAQGSAALINLTYTVDDGNDFNTTYKRPGMVTVSNLTCLMSFGRCADGTTTQGLAGTYAETILGSDCASYEELSTTQNPSRDYPYYCRTGRRKGDPTQEFAYRFKEYNPNDTQLSYPRFTDRIIKTSSGPCDEYPEVGKRKEGSFYGYKASIISYSNGSTTANISIPTTYLGWDSTTYLYQGFHTPQHAEWYKCGPRCLYMWAFKGHADDKNGTFYRCPIIISEVSNAGVNSQHQIPNDTALIAAASIGLEGHHNNGADNDGDLDFRQFRYYPNG